MKTNIQILILLLILLSACSTRKEDTIDIIKIEEDIVAVEKAFSDYSKEHGFTKALAKYAAEDVIKLNDNGYATFGKTQIEKEALLDSVGTSGGVLTWKPLKVRVAGSGDMAAAFGDWYFTLKSRDTSRDTTIYGNYLTVWVKQKDGSWKFAIDGGNPTPGPTTNAMLDLLK